MENTFFNFKLDLEPNIIDMIYDLLRMSTIQLVTQIMFYMNNSSLSLFNETFIKTFVFINISIIFYYLVVRKVFSFISDDYLNTYFKEDDRPYAGTPPIGSSNNSNRTSLSSGLKTSTPSNKTNNSIGRGLSRNNDSKPANTSSNNNTAAANTTTTTAANTQPTAAATSNISTPSIGSTPI